MTPDDANPIVFTPGHVGAALSTDGKTTVLVVDDAKLGRFLLPLQHEAAVDLATELAATATVGQAEAGE